MNPPGPDFSQEALWVKEESQSHNSSWCFDRPVDLTEEMVSSQAGSPNSRAPRWSCRIGCQTDSSKSPWDSWFLLLLTLHIQVLLVHRCSLFLNFGRHSWGQRHWKCSSHGGPGRLIKVTRKLRLVFKPSSLVSKVLGEAWYQDWFGLILPLWKKVENGNILFWHLLWRWSSCHTTSRPKSSPPLDWRQCQKPLWMRWKWQLVNLINAFDPLFSKETF